MNKKNTNTSDFELPRYNEWKTSRSLWLKMKTGRLGVWSVTYHSNGNLEVLLGKIFSITEVPNNMPHSNPVRVSNFKHQNIYSKEHSAVFLSLEVL